MENNYIDNHGKPIPKKLYRFRKWDEPFQKDLSSYQLRLTSPEYFNDPYDCHVPPLFEDLNSHFNEYVAMMEEKPDNFYSNLGQDKNKFIENLKLQGKFSDQEILHFKIAWVQKVRAEYKLVCLSRSYKNVLLWAYYGEGHAGICYELDTINFIQNRAKSDCKIRFGGNIEYEMELPSFSLFNDSEKSIHNLFFTKQKCWEHEEEYRFVFENAPDTLRIDPNEISTFYLGTVFPRAKYRETFEFLKKYYPDAEVMVMGRRINEIYFESHPIEKML